MPKPITPLATCDVFITDNQNKVLLIQRGDNKMWALPGGCHDLGETPKQCAIRECFEETGFHVKITNLLGVYSSNCYEYDNYPWKDNEFCHIFFAATITGGVKTTSAESLEIEWFPLSQLPPLSDGHAPRIEFGFQWLENKAIKPYFE